MGRFAEWLRGPEALNIGSEAVEGQPAEALLQERLQGVIRDFDTDGIWLLWIMIHHFGLKSPPDDAWVAEETIDGHGVDGSSCPLRLPPRLLERAIDKPGVPPWAPSV